MTKVPPHNKEAEQSLIAILMANPELLVKVEEPYIYPNDFYYNNFSIVYQAMQELAAETDKIDIVGIWKKMEENGTSKQLKDMVDLVTIANTDTFIPPNHVVKHAKIVKEMSIRRKAIKTGNILVEDAYNKQIKVNEALERADGAIQRVSQKWEKCFEDQSKTWSEAMEDVINRREGSTKGYNAGIYSVDKYTLGLKRGHYWVVYAFTGTGKTYTALGLAHNVIKQGGSVRFVSLEMSEEEIWDRLVTIEEGGDNNLGAAFDRIQAYEGRFGVKVDLNSINSIGRYIKRLAATTDVFFVDYLGLIRNGDRNEMERLLQVSDELRFYAKKYNTCIVALAQTNKDAMNAWDHEFCVRGGPQVIAPCHAVIRLKRVSDKDTGKQAMKFILQKNRFGRAGTVDEHPINTSTGAVDFSKLV